MMSPEKVAERIFWRPGERVEAVGLRSRAFEHALGIVQERTIYFVKKLGWLIHDRLCAPGGAGLAGRRIDWLLHTPYGLVAEGPGLLHGAGEGGGLLVLAGNPEELDAPVLEKKPSAVPLREARGMRLWDAGRRLGSSMTADITALAWRRKPVSATTCEFAVALIPYQGARPRAQLLPGRTGWTLRVNGREEIIETAAG